MLRLLYTPTRALWCRSGRSGAALQSKRAVKGEPFAAAKESGLTDDQLPVEGFPELRSVFTSNEQLRNPLAHSYCFTSRKEREQFFLVADRWLNCVLSVCPAQTTRNDLIELIEPLPLLSRDGEVLCF